ncbi:WD domain, G-beta repeat family protein [Aspergillus niger]|uniref:WD domain, G-beta repeat family protein n=1 Tax=Aspergillus niger TaxID=5061 RepID=A0A505IIX9_ASPNG|nr:WD domain, G-beta repeat family protein [Aspergillus niger]
MSLKRKASVPSLTSSNPAPVLSRPSFVADDSPKHLHSRTRKRFRNDRPDDEVVYDEDEATEPEPVPSSEIVDPRQQTLLKFFRPSQSTPSHIRMNKLDQQSNHVIPLQTTTFQSPNFNLSSPVTSTGWSTSSPPSQLTGSDMDMDSITNESVQEPRRPPGGCGWA